MFYWIRIIIVVLIFKNFASHAQPSSIGGRANGIGKASVTLQDGWSVFNNIGGMAGVTATTALFSYGNQFGWEHGFNTVAAGFILPTRFGNGSVSAVKFGDDLFSKQQLSLGYCQKINQISFGTKISRLQYHIEGWGAKSIWVLEIGGMAAIIPKLDLGLHIYNINQARISQNSQDQVPLVMKAGLSYKPSGHITVLIETEKNVQFDPVFRTGIEYKIINALRLRTGISTQPFSAHYGFGLHLKRFNIDYAMNTHAQLGFSHQLSISYQLKNNAL